MIDDKRVIAIIPARGGSKGLPRKNIRTLLGKPLIAWSIEQAKICKYIDRVIVSSEDEEILNIAKDYGADTIRRPMELAKDYTPTSDVIMHVLDFLNKNGEFYEILVLLEPTSPLRKRDDLTKSIEKFVKYYDKADSLVSLGEVHLENPFVCKVIENGVVRPLIETDKVIYQRQKYPKVYFPYGVVYIVKSNIFKIKRTFYLENTIPYLIERWQNYEIDDIYDFICVEAILREKIKEVL